MELQAVAAVVVAVAVVADQEPVDTEKTAGLGLKSVVLILEVVKQIAIAILTTPGEQDSR